MWPENCAGKRKIQIGRTNNKYIYYHRRKRTSPDMLSSLDSSCCGCCSPASSQQLLPNRSRRAGKRGLHLAIYNGGAPDRSDILVGVTASPSSTKLVEFSSKWGRVYQPRRRNLDSGCGSSAAETGAGREPSPEQVLLVERYENGAAKRY